MTGATANTVTLPFRNASPVPWKVPSGEVMGDPKTFEEAAGRYDLVLNTVSAPLDFAAYLSLLRTDGTTVNLGRRKCRARPPGCGLGS